MHRERDNMTSCTISAPTKIFGLVQTVRVIASSNWLSEEPPTIPTTQLKNKTSEINNNTFSMVLGGLGWSQTIPEIFVIDFSIVDRQNHVTGGTSQDSTCFLGSPLKIRFILFFHFYTFFLLLLSSP